MLQGFIITQILSIVIGAMIVIISNNIYKAKNSVGFIMANLGYQV